MAFDAEKISDIAAAQIADDPEGGASLCVVVEGETVVDWTGGFADAQGGVPYTADTLQIVQSMGKGVIAAVAALLVSRGQLDPAAPIASYWPEFATNGKADITVAQLFSHQAGLVYLDATMPLALTTDRVALEAALVAQAPAWEPGTKVGYSPQVFGNYADVLFARATGQGFAELLGELTAALQIEMTVGLPAEQRHRAARVLPALAGAGFEPPAEWLAQMADPDSLLMRVMRNIPGAVADQTGVVNGDAIRDAFMPAANMFASSRSFAVLYDALLRSLEGADTGLWSRESLETSTRELVRGTDAWMLNDTAFALGFQKTNGTYPFARSPRAFGHAGAGGSVAFADPDAGFAMCWIATRYTSEFFDDRQRSVIDAVYAALA